MNEIHVIPKPVRITPKDGAFRLKPTTRIRAFKDAWDIGGYLQGLLRRATGFSLALEESTDNRLQPDTILLTAPVTGEAPANEGYELKVTPKAVAIYASKPAGLFYGVQTLRQLLPPEIEGLEEAHRGAWTVPAAEIEDRPRFVWRGIHLDVGRHMFPLEFIKQYIDFLAIQKMNVFHWHLTEDQGWRIEIKKYPRLTEIGSRRAATPLPSDRSSLDSKPYGGFYTQEQIEEVVRFAANRFVTVVPEIEMPGHAQAALASYPELGCTGGPYEVRTHWGISEEVYCAGNEKVYTFLEDVLSEVLRLFPSEFIHIGGDECPKQRWEQCPKCQAMIRKHGLKDEHELQSYFVRRIAKLLNAQGRRLIGWDEILEGGLAPNASVMSWQGMEGGIRAVKEGHDVVMSPTSHCYLDYYQSTDKHSEPPAFNRFLPLETVYALEPVPTGLSPEEASHILGAQGNVWTEYMPTAQQVEYMTYPRASALAEVVWSPADSRDFQDFTKRLKAFLQRLRLRKINFRDPFSS